MQVSLFCNYQTWYWHARQSIQLTVGVGTGVESWIPRQRLGIFSSRRSSVREGSRWRMQGLVRVRWRIDSSVRRRRWCWRHENKRGGESLALFESVGKQLDDQVLAGWDDINRRPCVTEPMHYGRTSLDAVAHCYVVRTTCTADHRTRIDSLALFEINDIVSLGYFLSMWKCEGCVIWLNLWWRNSAPWRWPMDTGLIATHTHTNNRSFPIAYQRVQMKLKIANCVLFQPLFV